MAVTEVDPAKVKGTWGAIIIDGFAEGSMVKIDHKGKGNSSVVGATGEAAVVRSYDRSAESEVSLMPGSASNAALGAAWQLGNPLQPFAVADLNTGTLHLSGYAVLKLPPDADYAGDGSVPVRKWTFIIPKLEDVII